MQEGKVINIGVSIVLNLLGATLIIVMMRVVYRNPSFFGSPTVLLVGAVLCFFFAFWTG
jgi:hypothetical protein